MSDRAPVFGAEFTKQIDFPSRAVSAEIGAFNGCGAAIIAIRAAPIDRKIV
jgi:hypothetical protein